MTTGRPTAKQAIEVLRIHQLRRENGAIFEEVKGLREDVTNRQSDLDEARKDVSKLTDELKQMQQIVCDYGTRLAQFDTGPPSYAEELKKVQQNQRSLREEFCKANKAFDAINLQNQSTIKELVEEVTLLKTQMIDWEKTCANSMDELRNDLANRAERGVVAELEDKLEDFVQEIDARFESLQKVNCVTDSFPSARKQRSGRGDHLHNVSSPTAPAPSHFSYEHDSNRGRWEPIDTQAALRATPPAMPETLILARPREDTNIQTPSTLRSTVPTREAISNIFHTEPVVGQILANAPQHLDPPATPLEVGPQQTPTVEPVQKTAEANWDALNAILKLRQRGSETLAQYLARFQVGIRRFPADCDIVAACLKRLVSGMGCNEERQFVQEWLTTSDWTLENVRDCILLLTRCRIGSNMIHTEPGSLELHATVTTLAERCNSSHDFRQSSLPHSHSDQNPCTALSPKGQLGKQQNLPRQVELYNQRVQPVRAAKIQKVGKASKDKICQNGHVDTTNVQQDKVDGNVLNMESALAAGPNSLAEPTGMKQDVITKKKSHKSRLQKELKSLMNTKLIEKSTKEPTAPQKRKALHQPDEDIQPASQLHQDSRPALAKRHVKPKRVPTLVARNHAKTVTVLETSDALRLPSMPLGLDNDREQVNREIKGGGRTSSHDNSPKLPVLALSTSDFQE